MSHMSHVCVDTRVSVVSHVGVHIYMSVLWVWWSAIVSVRDMLCESYVTHKCRYTCECGLTCGCPYIYECSVGVVVSYCECARCVM